MASDAYLLYCLLYVVGVAIKGYHTLIITDYYSLFLLVSHNRHHLGEELYKATNSSDVERVRELLMKGADVNWRDSLDCTALHIASHGRPDIVKMLLKSSPNINQQNFYGDTALHKACGLGDINGVKLLLATGQCDTGQLVCQCDVVKFSQIIYLYLYAVCCLLQTPHDFRWRHLCDYTRIMI